MINGYPLAPARWHSLSAVSTGLTYQLIRIWIRYVWGGVGTLRRAVICDGTSLSQQLLYGVGLI